MQVKKFEATTLQEALETIKRELGPDAIILKTVRHRKGFGLLSKSSVEVTAAISDEAIGKKKIVEERLSTGGKQQILTATATQQKKVFERIMDKHLKRSEMKTVEKVELSSKSSQPKKRITSTRYIDIDAPAVQEKVSLPPPVARPQPAFSEFAMKAIAAEGMQQKVMHEPRSAMIVSARGASSDENLKKEIEDLKSVISELKKPKDAVSEKSEGPASSLTADARYGHVFEELIVNGVDRKLAWELMKKVSFELGQGDSFGVEQILDQLAQEIMDHTVVDNRLFEIQAKNEATADADPKVHVFVGPSGVGKTTTIAKLAKTLTEKKELKVGLIEIMDKGSAIRTSLETYAKLLNIPYRMIEIENAAENIAITVKEFQRLDLVLIDSPGYSQKNVDSLIHLRNVIHTLKDKCVQLVLSSNTKDHEMMESFKKFSSLRPEALIISKLDESLSFGSVYNISQKSHLPLAVFTTGQRIPEDIEPATQERVVALIMDL